MCKPVVCTFTDQVRTDAFAERIDAWLLPVDRVDLGSASRDHWWRSPREVSQQVLATSTRLAATVNPTERDAAAVQSITFDVPEGRFVYLRINAGLESTGGFLMASAYDAVVRMPQDRKGSIHRAGWRGAAAHRYTSAHPLGARGGDHQGRHPATAAGHHESLGEPNRRRHPRSLVPQRMDLQRRQHRQAHHTHHRLEAQTPPRTNVPGAGSGAVSGRRGPVHRPRCRAGADATR